MQVNFLLILFDIVCYILTADLTKGIKICHHENQVFLSR